MTITIKKLGSSRVQATVILDDAKVRERSDQAVMDLGKEVTMKGFRPGKVPMEVLREQIDPQRIHERVIQAEMPAIMSEIMSKHGVKPIIRPRVELNTLEPMTLILTLVEKPGVKVASRKIKLSKVKEEKKESKEEKEAKETREVKEKTPEEVKQEEDAKLLALIAENTTVELPQELIDDEAESLLEEHARRLAEFGLKFEDWIVREKKTIPELMQDLRPSAEKRLKIRFGVAALVVEYKIEVNDAEMQQAIEMLLTPLQGTEHGELRDLYKPGNRAYEQFKFQKKVEKLLEELRQG
ncbi:MAG TPA: trigger factor [Candidatus Peribacterales bacterium]|nr:trigger factor [Candidatus Peribacterales bacterium]